MPNVKRLQVLVEFLRKLPKEKFNLRNWQYSNGWGICVSIKSLEDLKNCGTTACALGWASLIPEFKKAGLDRNTSGCPSYKGEYGFGAAMKFFAICYEDSKYLFIDESYNTLDKTSPKQVANRIERFLTRKENRNASKASAKVGG